MTGRLGIGLGRQGGGGLCGWCRWRRSRGPTPARRPPPGAGRTRCARARRRGGATRCPRGPSSAGCPSPRKAAPSAPPRRCLRARESIRGEEYLVLYCTCLTVHLSISNSNRSESNRWQKFGLQSWIAPISHNDNGITSSMKAWHAGTCNERDATA